MMREQDLHALIRASRLPDPEEGHLDPSNLMDYRDDLLEPEQCEAIADHLADCRACGDTLLALQIPLAFDPQPFSQSMMKSDQMNLGAGEGPLADRLDSVGRLVWLKRWAPWMATAACLLLAVTVWLQREAPRPLPGGDIVTLVPTRVAERSGQPVHVVGKNRPFTLALSFSEPTAAKTFSLQIYAEDILIWEDAVERGTSGMFTLVVLPGFLEKGTYSVVLLGDGERLATYDLGVSNSPRDLL